MPSEQTSSPHNALVSTWNEDQVVEWMAASGFSSYERVWRENGITGDVLIHLDHETLKDLSIRSVGRRIAILNAIYHLKVDQQIDFEDDDYRPATERIASDSPASPSEQSSPHESDTIRRLLQATRERDATVNKLLAETQNLANEMNRFREELLEVRKLVTKTQVQPETPGSAEGQNNYSMIPFGDGRGASDTLTRKAKRHSSDVTFRMSPDDPCHKVLPAALKKYNIHDDWHQYALFITYGENGLYERCLNYDEKPLRIFQQLKNAKQSPSFLLKHIKQMGSPLQRTSPPTRTGSINQTKRGTDEASAQGGRAVAIYEYAPQRDDELQVHIGDRFSIKSRSIGWWEVIDKEGRSGYVPSGCLLQDNDEEEEEEDRGGGIGTALCDLDGMSANELSIREGETLIVRKTYQHWLLCEVDDRKGWVPSCYVCVSNEGERSRSDAGGSYRVVRTDRMSGTDGIHGEKKNRGLLLKVDGSGPMASSSSSSGVEVGDTATESNVRRRRSLKGHDAIEETPREESSKFSKRTEGFLPAKLYIPDPSADSATRSGELTSTFRKQSAQASSPALFKLSSLLDSINPYLDEEEPQTDLQQQQGAEVTTRIEEGTKKESRVTEALLEIGDSLLNWNPQGNTPKGSSGSLSTETDGQLANALELVDLIESVEPENPRYTAMLSMLEKIVQEGRTKFTERGVDGNDEKVEGGVEPGGELKPIESEMDRRPSVQETVEKLADVVNMVLDRKADDHVTGEEETRSDFAASSDMLEKKESRSEKKPEILIPLLSSATGSTLSVLKGGRGMYGISRGGYTTVPVKLVNRLSGRERIQQSEEEVARNRKARKELKDKMLEVGRRNIAVMDDL